MQLARHALSGVLCWSGALPPRPREVSQQWWSSKAHWGGVTGAQHRAKQALHQNSSSAVVGHECSSRALRCRACCVGRGLCPRAPVKCHSNVRLESMLGSVAHAAVAAAVWQSFPCRALAQALRRCCLLHVLPYFSLDGGSAPKPPFLVGSAPKLLQTSSTMPSSYSGFRAAGLLLSTVRASKAAMFPMRKPCTHRYSLPYCGRCDIQFGRERSSPAAP